MHRAVIGRLASLKTTYQKGTVTDTLLYIATELVITVTDAEENNISGSTAAETLNGTDVVIESQVPF